jgi:hypothetical protein
MLVALEDRPHEARGVLLRELEWVRQEGVAERDAARVPHHPESGGHTAPRTRHRLHRAPIHVEPEPRRVQAIIEVSIGHQSDRPRLAAWDKETPGVLGRSERPTSLRRHQSRRHPGLSTWSVPHRQAMGCGSVEASREDRGRLGGLDGRLPVPGAGKAVGRETAMGREGGACCGCLVLDPAHRPDRSAAFRRSWLLTSVAPFGMGRGFGLGKWRELGARAISVRATASSGRSRACRRGSRRAPRG